MEKEVIELVHEFKCAMTGDELGIIKVNGVEKCVTVEEYLRHTYDILNIVGQVWLRGEGMLYQDIGKELLTK